MCQRHIIIYILYRNIIVGTLAKLHDGCIMTFKCARRCFWCNFKDTCPADKKEGLPRHCDMENSELPWSDHEDRAELLSRSLHGLNLIWSA